MRLASTACSKEQKQSAWGLSWSQASRGKPEEAVRRSGPKDTISFHHHFRNGDNIVNLVGKLWKGFRNLTMAASSLSGVHAPLTNTFKTG